MLRLCWGEVGSHSNSHSLSAHGRRCFRCCVFHSLPSQGQQAGSHENRAHLLRALKLWHAPAAVPARLLRLSPALAAAAAEVSASAEDFRSAIHALLVAAAVTRRVAVLPSFPCAAAAGRGWVARSGETLHGYDDAHFLSYLRDSSGGSSSGSSGGSKGESESSSAVSCAPYLSRSDLCSDAVVWSEFQLEQDLLYPSYPHVAGDLLPAPTGGGAGGGDTWAEFHPQRAAGNGSIVLGEEEGDAAAAVGRERLGLLLSQLRAAAGEAQAARVVTLGGPLGALALLARVPTTGGAGGASSGGGEGGEAMLLLLDAEERGRVRALRERCFDFFGR